MIGHRTFSLILILTLLLASLPGPVRAYALSDEKSTPSETALPETLEGGAGATTDWWSAVQEDIRQSEYHVTWQEHTHLEAAEAAYQAPNRAHNLRTTFTFEGIHVVPRVFEETPPWEWGLTLSGYGREGDVRPVTAATLQADANRIEYERDTLTEWYVNDERGLEQGFTLQSPPTPYSLLPLSWNWPSPATSPPTSPTVAPPSNSPPWVACACCATAISTLTMPLGDLSLHR